MRYDPESRSMPNETQVIWMGMSNMKSLVIVLFLLGESALGHSNKGKPIAEEMSLVPSGGIQLPTFELKDPTGAVVKFPDVATGNYALVYFGFTSCTEACPLAATYIKSELKQLSKKTPTPNLYFVSVDPEGDTPTKVGAWLKAFDPQWVGLLGPMDALRRAAKPFGASFDKALPAHKATEKVLHSSIVYLVNPEGKWSQYLRLPAKKGVLREAIEDLPAKKTM
jgi:cytochrome oxidase Cu insertion factor (SCO1/SenC/PrrC family)